MPIRVLVVDDHALLRKGIRLLTSTESDMQLVAEASTGREAVQEFRTHRPDITLMDLQMPEMNGVEAIIAIRGEFPNARVIVLTTYAGDAQVVRALNAGARGYLLKGKINTELLETIRAVRYAHHVLKDRAGYLWVSNDESLDRFDPRTETSARWPIDRNAPHSVFGTVWHMNQDRGSGHLWVGIVSPFTRFAVSGVRRLQGFHEAEIAFHHGIRRWQ